MKLHNLKMTAFGPFAGEAEVRFDELDQGAPFLLTGPTGSGKTSILDAVCFALYGRIPRSAKAVPDVASRFRDDDAQPSVEVELTIAGERLRVRRTPVYTRQKQRGDGEREIPATAGLWRLGDGEPESLCSKPTEVNREISGRLNMTAEQFGQVVMLPQGDFSRFLKAGAHERRELLEQLFPGENLSEVQQWLEDEAARIRTARDDKRRQIEDSLTAAWSVVSDVWETREEEQPEMPGPLEPKSLTETVEEVGAVLRADRDLSGAAEAAASKTWTDADRACSKAKERHRLVRERGEQEDRRSRLQEGAGKIEEVRARVEVGRRSAIVQPLAEAAVGRRATAEQAARSLAEKIASLEADPAVESLDRPSLEGRARELRERETTLKNFEDSELPKRRELETRLTGLEGLSAELNSPGSAALAGLAEAEERVQARRSELDAARRRRLHIRDCRNAGMAAELAGGLVEGEPCVVCGSTEHPSPAGAEAGQEIFEKAEEDAAEATVGAAETAFEGSKSAKAELEAGIAERKTKTASDLEAVGAAVETVREAEQRLLDGAASIGERRELIGGTADRIESALKLMDSEANARSAGEESVRDAAEAAAANGFESLDEALAGAVEAAELDRLGTEVRGFDEELAAIAGRLDEGELKEIDRDEQVPLTDSEATLKAASESRDATIEVATTCRNRLSTFVSYTKDLEGMLGELGPLTERCDLVSGLSAAASGRNQKRIQLSNFVLAARLKQVIAQANLKLGPMSGDRYALRYTEEADGRGPAGLGIRIFDAHISDERSTRTLSGGETFYCSLALALGLAEVVQSESGGRHLETLFIDEGFGTLDSETLNQVMNQIENLRADGRSVGLVSHVEEMQSRISAQIQVTPSRSGSTLKLVGV